MTHPLRPRFWSLTGLSLGIVFALAALLWLGLRPASAQTPPLNVSASPTDPIQMGETATFTATLGNPTGQARTVVLSMTLSGPIEARQFSPVPEASAMVSTQNFRIQGNTAVWRGQIGPGGQLTLAADVRSHKDESGEITLAAAAGPALDNLPANDQASVTVQAPPSLGQNDLSVSQMVASLDANDEFELIFDTGSGLEVISGDKLRALTRVANTGGARVFALITGSLQPQSVDAAQSGETFCRARILGAQGGVPIPNAALGALQADYGFVVAIGAGRAVTVETQVQVAGGIGCVLQSDVQVRARALPQGSDAPAIPQARLVRALAGLTPIASLTVPWVVVASDYGDAPDSLYWGHVGNPEMLAYTNPDVPGNFPTSFYAGKPGPQGPKHQFVNPLYLGNGFSLERWADRGPRRNIDPVTLAADLDLNDDGIDPNNLTLQHCTPATIPFRFTISQDAVDRLGQEDKNVYLNIWLDGNRDGDWADTLDCDGIEAREHIVIDQMLAPPTGGVYNLIAATGNLPIPQNQCQEMWLRVSLSDEPSVKLPGQSYGDGRGPDTGFRLGETEDYLVLPVGCEAANPGVDLALASEVRVQWEPAIPSLNPAQRSSILDKSTPKLLQRVRIQNVGTLPAAGKLIIQTDPDLGLPTFSASGFRECLTCTRSLEMPAALVDGVSLTEAAEAASLSNLPWRTICPQGEGNCYLELDLATLRPGQRGEILLGWKVEEGIPWKVEEGEAVKVTARIETAGDVNLQNNVFERITRPGIQPMTILFPPPGTYGFSEPITATLRADGADPASAHTGRWHFREPLTATFKLRLFGQPGSTFVAKVGDADVGSGAFNSNGLWSGSFALPTGDANLNLSYQSVPGYTAGEVAGITQPDYYPLRLRGDLPWNPGSLKINPLGWGRSGGDEGEPPAGIPVVDAAGLAATDDWLLPVLPGQETSVGVDLNCHGPGYAALRIGDGDPIPLSNDGESHRYTGSFTANGQASQPVELIVGCNDPHDSRFTSQGRVTQSRTADQQDPCAGNYEQCWVFSGATEIVPQATLLDAETGEPIQGGVAQLWRFRRDASGIQAQSWPGAEYGQQNPVTTGADGGFGFSLTPGFYGVTIAAEGYQPLRVGPLRLCCHWPPEAIKLQPIPPGTPTQDVTFTEEGFVNGWIEVISGSLLNFRNLSLDFASFGEGTDGLAAAQADPGRNSGLVAPGESFLVEFPEPGSYTFFNQENPAQSVTVIVADEAQGDFRIFLPAVESGQ